MGTNTGMDKLLGELRKLSGGYSYHIGNEELGISTDTFNTVFTELLNNAVDRLNQAKADRDDVDVFA